MIFLIVRAPEVSKHAWLAKPLLEILCDFSSYQVGDSLQVSTVITVERLVVFDFNAHIALK